MLVEKSKFEVGNIINIKLVSGDEICGELVAQHDHGLEIRRPCVVVTSPEGIGLIQAMFGLDPDIENLVYKNEHIITRCHTHHKMREHYVDAMKQVDSGVTEGIIES